MELKLPEEIVEELQTRASDFGFNSPEIFVHYVLKELLEAIKKKDFLAGGKNIGEQEEKELRAKLQDLGYM